MVTKLLDLFQLLEVIDGYDTEMNSHKPFEKLSVLYLVINMQSNNRYGHNLGG